MWADKHYPSRHWPLLYWPSVTIYVPYMDVPVINRTLRTIQWHVILIDRNDVEYDLGWMNVDTNPVQISVPPSVPNGSYTVKVAEIRGIAWSGLVQSPTFAITIDRTSSTPIQHDLPLFRNLSYNTNEEWITLTWDTDKIPNNVSISAAIWLSSEVPTFSSTDDAYELIPLLADDLNSTYDYRIDLTTDYKQSTEDGYWLPNFWQAEYYYTNYWMRLPIIRYAGVAPVNDSTGEIGYGLYVKLPDRPVLIPPAHLVEA